MKNFTKSVLYSTTIVAVGLVAAFAIYNNVATQDSSMSMANISPASGQSDLGVNFGEALDNPNYVFGETSTEMMENSAEALSNIISAAGDEVSEIVEGAVDNIDEDAAADGTTKEDHSEKHVEKSEDVKNHTDNGHEHIKEKEDKLKEDNSH